MKLACNEWYQEPDMKVNSKEYLEYCLDFCKEHNIDVFVPHKGRIIISKNKIHGCGIVAVLICSCSMLFERMCDTVYSIYLRFRLVKASEKKN